LRYSGRSRGTPQGHEDHRGAGVAWAKRYMRYHRSARRRGNLQPSQEQPGSPPSMAPMQAGGRNPRTIRIIVILIVIILAVSAVTAYYVLVSQSSACHFSS